MWKGIAIFGIWGAVAAVALAGGTEQGTIGAIAGFAMIATIFVAGN